MKSLPILCFLVISTALIGQDFEAAFQIGGSSLDIVLDLEIDGENDLIVAGLCNNDCDMDPGQDEFTLSPGGGFIGKYTSDGEFLWAIRIEDRVEAIAIDELDNIYATGRFNGSFDFDPGEGVFELTADDLNDAFLAKYDPSGNFIWAISIEGEDNEYGLDVTVDEYEDVIVTGSYEESVAFDLGKGDLILNSNGLSDIFVAKYDYEGYFLWAGSVGGTSVDVPHAVSSDWEGNVLLTGEFRETGDFDPGSGFEILEGIGDEDIFVLKLNGSGELVWAKAMVGTDEDIAFGIGADANTNIYVAGRFEDDIDFEPGTQGFQFESEDCYDVYLQKILPDGTTDWVRHMNSSACSYVEDMKLDENGGVYMVGHFSGTMDFDPSPENALRTSNGGRDIYLCKLSESGQYNWATSFGGPATFDQDRGRALGVDNSGFLFAGGDFENIVDFDPGQGEFFMQSVGDGDGFIWKGTGGILNIDAIEKEGIQVYPNPTSGRLILETGQRQIASLRVYNTHGKLIDSHTSIHMNKPEILLGEFKGMAIVEITLEDGTKIAKKVIVQ